MRFIFAFMLAAILNLHAEEDWLTFNKIEETYIDNTNLLIVYRADNFPPNCDFTLIHEAKDGTTAHLGTGKTDEKGILIGKTGMQFHLNNYSVGESYIVHLKSKDGSINIARRVTPFPLETIGNDGAKVEAELLNHKTYKCDLSGFQPNEELKVISFSCDEKMIQKQSVDNQGKLCIIMAPAVIGKKGGICCMTFMRQNEVLNLKLPWGDRVDPIKPKDRKEAIPFEKSQSFKNLQTDGWRLERDEKTNEINITK